MTQQLKLEKETLNNIRKKLRNDDDHVMIGYLLGQKKEDGSLIVEEVYIPEQKTTATCAEVTSQAVFKAARDIRRNGKEVIGSVQYNGNISVFESATTREFRKDLSNQLGFDAPCLVINNTDEVYISD